MRRAIGTWVVPLLLITSLSESFSAAVASSSGGRYVSLKNTTTDFPDDSNLANTVVASDSKPAGNDTKQNGDILVTESLHPDGYRVKRYLGPVVGISVRFSSLGLRNIPKAFTGGRAGTFEKAYLRAANDAKDDMISRAKDLGANAVLGARLMNGYSSTWFGDAVIVEPIEQTVAPRSKEEG